MERLHMNHSLLQTTAHQQQPKLPANRHPNDKDIRQRVRNYGKWYIAPDKFNRNFQ